MPLLNHKERYKDKRTPFVSFKIRPSVRQLMNVFKHALNETVAPRSLEYEQMRLLSSALNQLLAQRSLRPV